MSDKPVTILIPTCNRESQLGVLLTSLFAQTFSDFSIVISDQSDSPPEDLPHISTLKRLFTLKGIPVLFQKNLPRQGMAQQRNALLSLSGSPYSLFLDDDLILEDFVVSTLYESLREENVGFSGMPVISLSYLENNRLNEQNIEFWNGQVVPETITPRSSAWERHKLHNAANPYHITRRYGLTPDSYRKYKVAWIGGCTLFDTEKLRSVGGFSFWKKLPRHHAGEDVLAQLKVMKRYGGYGILPSGVYHQEGNTTLPDRQINAPEYLDI